MENESKPEERETEHEDKTPKDEKHKSSKKDDARQKKNNKSEKKKVKESPKKKKEKTPVDLDKVVIKKIEKKHHDETANDKVLGKLQKL